MQRRASGLQIAFLMFAVMLLSVPAADLLLRDQGWSAEAKNLALRMIPFGVFAILLLTVPGMRRKASQFLRQPIPRHRRTEVVIVAFAMVPLWWATSGLRALWAWLTGGSERLATVAVNETAELIGATSGIGLVKFLFLGVLVAPLLEELLCRGFLYRAFQRDWGSIPALIATSIVFGAYHPFFLNAFLSSIVWICLLRRTGSLRATILVHASSNLLAWWPLMGQYVFPNGSQSPGEIASWSLNLGCAAVVAVAIPAYVCMARDRHEVAATVMLEPNGTLSK